MGRTLKLLYVAESYPPDYGGGAGIYIRDICETMARRGHDVVVISTTIAESEPYTVSMDEQRGVVVHRVNLPYFRTADPDGWQLGLRAWRRHEQRIAAVLEPLVATIAPDLAQYNASRPFGEEVFAVLGRLGVPVLAMFHEAWLICPRLMLLRSPDGEPCEGPGPVRCATCLYSHYDGTMATALAKLPWRVLKQGPLPLYRIVRRRAVQGGVIAGTGYSRFMTEAHRPFVSGLVEHIPLGINLTGLPSERPTRPRSPLRFGFIGGSQGLKGIDLILEAASSLRSEGYAFEVHVWGPGRETLERLVAERGLGDRVRLRGMYAGEELWDAYGEMDVALMATKVSEALGRVPLEAAAMGAPTIAPAIGGIPESIRHDVDGLLFEFKNVEDLTRQMRRVLAEPGLLERLISNLQPVPDTRDRAVALEAFYTRVLEERERTDRAGLPVGLSAPGGS